MKRIRTSKEYIERHFEDGYVIHLTPDEFETIKKALLIADIETESDMQICDWLKTPETERELYEFKRIREEMRKIPF